MTSHGHIASYWAHQTGIRPIRALEQAIKGHGKDLQGLGIYDREFLSPLDEFHCLGQAATNELANMLGLSREAYVLDIGCGLGGPARTLATEFGCRVTGIDLTQEFLEIASGITARMGLSNSVKFVHGDAVDVSFAGQRFDFAWMQVTAANIPERTELYRRAYAALREGGMLGLYDIFQTPGSSLKFPVPWSVDGSTSALFSEEETIAVAELCGFELIQRKDVSARALDWFVDQRRAAIAPRVGGPTRLGFDILLPQWGEMTRNQVVNLQRGVIRFGYLTFAKK